MTGTIEPYLTGIAILKPSLFRTNTIDKNGYFIDPAIKATGFMSASFGLEQFTLENPDYLKRLDELEDIRKTIAYDFKWLYGYDMAIEVTSQEINMSDEAR